MDQRILGVIMIIPTLFLAFYITYKFRSLLSELYHNIAVCLWITANTIWMIGEFFFMDNLRPYAMVFFISGLAVLLYYYLFVFQKVSKQPGEA